MRNWEDKDLTNHKYFQAKLTGNPNPRIPSNPIQFCTVVCQVSFRNIFIGGYAAKMLAIGRLFQTTEASWNMFTEM